MQSQIFSIVNLLAVAGWALLLAFPRRRWAELVSGRVLPALLSAAYVVIVAAVWGETPGGFSSLEAVSQLFDSQWMLLGGWIHYLAFDLFVGSWIARDAHERGIAHPWLVPIFIATFMFGPAGLLSYLALRTLVGAVRRGDDAATGLPRRGHAES